MDAPERSAIAAMTSLENQCRVEGHRLSDMRREVYRYFFNQPLPQTAYEVLDGLRVFLGRKVSPLSIYRALDFLVLLGRLHRLESLKAYMLCADPDHHHHAGVLLLCNDCGGAEEVDAAPIEAWIAGRADKAGFAPSHQVIEVLGSCHKCRG